MAAPFSCFLVAHAFGLVVAWNSAATQDDFYTFQEFYTDAQYGSDFGYYSTGRILNQPDAEGVSAEDSSYFNSYTTQPMSLSPFFGQLVCDRIVSMWNSMARPSPFFIIELLGLIDISFSLILHASDWGLDQIMAFLPQMNCCQNLPERF